MAFLPPSALQAPFAAHRLLAARSTPAWLRCSSSSSSSSARSGPEPATANPHHQHHPQTRLLQQKSGHDPLNATVPPLYQTATFAGLHRPGPPLYDYTRSGNPTRHMLEATVADLHGAERGFAFTSGMAALTAVLRAFTKAGDRVVAGSDLYGGQHRLLRLAAQQNHLSVAFVDLTNPLAVEEALQPQHNTRLVFAESPTNPMMHVVDLHALSHRVHATGALLCVDNSLMGPLLMQPHSAGADLVVESATKFLNGHSDVMAGLVTCRDPALAQRLAFLQNAEGAGLSPFDAWLVLRGIKTLPVRQQAAQRSAEILAKFLSSHRLVSQVNYLHPDYARNNHAAQLHFAQARGGGSVLSFLPANRTPEFSQHILNHVRLFKTSVSFGSVHSLIEMPCQHSHASIPSDQRGLDESLIRISVGLEDVNDLLSDLAQALHRTAEEDEPQLVEFKLGCPLPAHEPLHACGTAMPKWQDVVDYEESDPRVHKALVCGYPRFVYPPFVMELMDALRLRFNVKEDETVMPTASARVALRLQSFIAGATAQQAATRLIDLDFEGMCGVVMPKSAAGVAKAYWQHTGELVSSRFAAQALTHLEELYPPLARVITDGATDASLQLRRRVAGLLNEDERNVFLFPSGMASISNATRLVQTVFRAKTTRHGAKWVVFGFPYLDTLKLLRHPQFSPGAHFIPSGSIEELAALAKRENLLGIVTEFPSNPLLRSIDVRALRTLANEHGLPVIMDDSISGFCNVNLLGQYGADMLASSLTKSFNGTGNAMGGSLVFNIHSPFYHLFRQHFDASYEHLLYQEDAQVLLGNAADLESRNARVCATAEKLADYLQQHPAVANVFYPKYMDSQNYAVMAKKGSASDAVRWGGLMSIVLKDPSKAEAVYDALSVAKGPGFGTNFTLVCPYTVLAHYSELDFARASGVDPSLIRIWVGLEPIEDLTAAFESALSLAHAAEDREGGGERRAAAVGVGAGR